MTDQMAVFLLAAGLALGNVASMGLRMQRIREHNARVDDARQARRDGGPVFVSYAHRENDPKCPCNSCRWERHCAFECPRCTGDGVEPEVPGYTNCMMCNGTGQRNAEKSGL